MLFDVFKNKKVLITGHTGFKGSWLSLWLTQLGANVVGYSIDIPTSPSHFETLNLDKKLIDVRGDICDLSALKKVFQEHQPEIVFHLAARPIVRDCYENPHRAFQTNVMGTINILECLKESTSTRAAVLITSDKCYENVEWEYGYREDDRLGGSDPYSASKACAEIAISSYIRSYFSNSKCKITSVRAGNVIGGGDWARDRIVPDAVRSWSIDNELIIRNPFATRPWQLVLEPLSGYLTTAAYLLDEEKSKRITGEAFNFGPQADVIQPVSELVEEMLKSWEKAKFKIVQDPNAKKEANLLKLCCDKAQSRLEWKAILNFKETIQMTSSWYRDYYEHRKDMFEIGVKQISSYQEIARTRGLSWAK
jgi:CDP-glucose 4,6-dehydratase